MSAGYTTYTSLCVLCSLCTDSEYDQPSHDRKSSRGEDANSLYQESYDEYVNAAGEPRKSSSSSEETAGGWVVLPVQPPTLLAASAASDEGDVDQVSHRQFIAALCVGCRIFIVILFVGTFCLIRYSKLPFDAPAIICNSSTDVEGTALRF